MGSFLSSRRRWSCLSSWQLWCHGCAKPPALLSAWRWIFDADTVTPYRWLLLLFAVALVLGSLVLRGGSRCGCRPGRCSRRLCCRGRGLRLDR